MARVDLPQRDGPVTVDAVLPVAPVASGLRGRGAGLFGEDVAAVVSAEQEAIGLVRSSGEKGAQVAFGGGGGVGCHAEASPFVEGDALRLVDRGGVAVREVAGFEVVERQVA